MKSNENIDPKICRKARLARDARFDGKFFVAVRTTGIFCRPICPANPPKERNVEYFNTAIQAVNNGYRPCLRCRPDSAPQSATWIGVQSTLNRAIRLIEDGALDSGTVGQLAAKLGISDRYLRRLFIEYLGTSPKSYALFNQCMFVKQLLHQTSLKITEIALASGFNSIRRFNDCFSKTIGLTPSQVRKSNPTDHQSLALKLYYRPPYNWKFILNFLHARHIGELESIDGEKYTRTISYSDSEGYFSVEPEKNSTYLKLKLSLNSYKNMNHIVARVRRMFDLDADIASIEQHLKSLFTKSSIFQEGLRIPGNWGLFETGVRAILGQQISVDAAKKLVTTLVNELGQVLNRNPQLRLFPKPEDFQKSDLRFLKIPDSRLQTLKRFAEWYMNSNRPDDIDNWLDIKGIGYWTINYVKLRANNDPDIWLSTDLGVKKALRKIESGFDVNSVAPWRSYLTLHLWNQL